VLGVNGAEALDRSVRFIGLFTWIGLIARTMSMVRKHFPFQVD
jgi:hypothetical protein